MRVDCCLQCKSASIYMPLHFFQNENGCGNTYVKCLNIEPAFICDSDRYIRYLHNVRYMYLAVLNWIFLTCVVSSSVVTMGEDTANTTQTTNSQRSNTRTATRRILEVCQDRKTTTTQRSRSSDHRHNKVCRQFNFRDTWKRCQGLCFVAATLNNNIQWLMRLSIPSIHNFWIYNSASDYYMQYCK